MASNRPDNSTKNLRDDRIATIHYALPLANIRGYLYGHYQTTVSVTLVSVPESRLKCHIEKQELSFQFASVPVAKQQTGQ